MRRRRPKLSDERGMTLVELMLTMVIGVVVIGAGTLITIGAARHNVEVGDRTDATQRGTYALDNMEQLLRSEACSLDANGPIIAATPSSVTFYADLSGGATPVYQHTLTYDAANKQLTDTRVLGSTGTPQTFTGTSKTTTLATSVVQSGTTAVFRYWAYPSTAPGTGSLTPSVELVPSAAGLSGTDLDRVARVDIDYIATGGTNRNTAASIQAEMRDQVFVRLADPNSTTSSFDPSC